MHVASLAIQVHEHRDLGTHNFSDDRDGDVVHRAAVIALQPIDVGLIDRGHENDRCFLKTRMLADHRRQFEAIHFRHAHVHQHDGDVVLQKTRQRILPRIRFEQVLSKITEDRFVTQQLGRLVVHQQDVDRLVNHGL